MSNKTWQNVVVAAPVKRAAGLLPDEFTVDDVTLHVSGERSLEGAFWGKGTERFQATWRKGRWDGLGYVEVRPHSTSTAELVVHMAAPDGLVGRIAWPTDRLNRTALGVALGLRYEIDTKAEAQTDRVRVKRTTSKRRTA